MLNFSGNLFFDYEVEPELESSLSFKVEEYDNEIYNNEILNNNNNKRNIVFYIYQNKKKRKKREKKNLKKNNNNIKNDNQIKKPINHNSKSIHEKKSSSVIWKVNRNNEDNNIYRKDAYYKHFKAIFGQYIRNKINTLKNKCFPFFSRNNISSPNYKYIGNPKEKDNYIFLSFTIKDILLYGIDTKKQNRQYNNQVIIQYIENNELKSKDKDSYKELIQLLNDNLENVMINFYDDNKEFDKIKKDEKYIEFDKYYKHETGISLLEKYGFLEVLKKYSK